MIVETRGRLLDDEDGQPARAVLVSRDVTRPPLLKRRSPPRKKKPNVPTPQERVHVAHESRTENAAEFGARASHRFFRWSSVQRGPRAGRSRVQVGTASPHVDQRGPRHLGAVESGNIGLTTESLVLRDLVLECLTSSAPRRVNKASDRLHRFLRLSGTRRPPQTKAVILNLLSNAIKYTEARAA